MMKEHSSDKRHLPDSDKYPILNGVVGLKIKEYDK